MKDRAKRLARPCASPGLGLALADGSRWVIRALDEEAEATVRELGRVMGLGPGRGGRELCAVSGWKGGFGGRTVVCRLGPGRNRFAEVCKMERIANFVAEQSLARGGLLLHGALAVRDGAGFVLAGPSGVGKSTASRRLPSLWQSLSDDCVLVVRAPDGKYFAHPWPTWSLLRDKVYGSRRTVHGRWPVEQAVPLKALLFLKQASFDRAEPVGTTLATALIVESALRLVESVTLTRDGYASRLICGRYLRAAWALAGAVPAFRLQVSLTGRFWEEIERATRSKPQMNTDKRRCGPRRERNPESRNQKAELGKEGTTTDGRRWTQIAQRGHPQITQITQIARTPDSEKQPQINADGHGCGQQTKQNSETRNQNAELRKERTSADYADVRTAKDAKTEPESTTKTPRHEEASGEETAKTAKLRKELSADYADYADGREMATGVRRRRRSVPEPPRRLLSGSPKPRLVRFQTRDRAFLKLVRGRRVVASANDLLREWFGSGTR